MTNTATSTKSQLDIILICANDAVLTAENAENCARLALDAAVKTGDTQNYEARCALVAAMSAASVARDTLRKIADLRSQFAA
jgi:hypothetical protein